MISLLQSDIRVALKAAFANMDGPLSVIDWCRGRGNAAESAGMGDAYSFQYATGDIREPSSSMSIGGDSMSPPHSTSSNRGMPAVTCTLNLIILLQKQFCQSGGRDDDLYHMRFMCHCRHFRTRVSKGISPHQTNHCCPPFTFYTSRVALSFLVHELFYPT